MNALEELLHRRWILKRDDVDLYYRVKDGLGDIKKFTTEKLGYQLIVNQHLIKLEKIPGKVEEWMGITELQSIKEYQMLCMILMFLEEKEIEEQFVLSSLTEFIQVQLGEEVDWTNYTQRRQLVRVLKFCIKQGIIQQDDGDESGFASNVEVEVLYENTGTSRYFMRNFSKDIMEFHIPEDFDQSDWYDMDEDRGVIRRQRVYRRLLLSMGVFKDLEEKDEDFIYLRNQRNQIESELQSYFPCELQVHSSSAFLILDPSCNFGRTFPENNTLSDLVLLLNHALNQQVRKQHWKTKNEIIQIDATDLANIAQEVFAAHLKYLPKSYQIKSPDELWNDVYQYMVEFGMVYTQEETTFIYPIVGKLIGSY